MLNTVWRLTGGQPNSTHFPYHPERAVQKQHYEYRLFYSVPLCTHTRCENLKDFKVLQTHGNQTPCKIITLTWKKSVKQNQPWQSKVFPQECIGFPTVIAAKALVDQASEINCVLFCSWNNHSILLNQNATSPSDVAVHPFCQYESSTARKEIIRKPGSIPCETRLSTG